MSEASHSLALRGASARGGGSLLSRRFRACGCLVLLCLFLRNAAPAAFAQTTLSVSTTPVDFGEISSSGSFSGHGTVVVSAPAGTSFAVALSAGAHFAAGARHLSRLN